MEAHPVPQNVTDFQFHLVGDMTLKQFIYLASGLSLAYVLFAFFAAASFPFNLVVWFLIGVSSILGMAFAFLPIAERPLDHWVGAYMKAIFSPTKRSWRSKRKDMRVGDPIFNKRLSIYINQLDRGVQSILAPISSPQPRLTSIAQMAPITQSIVGSSNLNPIVIPQAAPPKIDQSTPDRVDPDKLPKSEELNKIVELAQQLQNIQIKIIETEKQLNQIKTTAATPGSNPSDYADKFQQVFKDLQQLTQMASTLSYQLAILSKSTPEKAAKKVIIVPTIKKAVQPQDLVLTSTPNVINGIVTDALNNYLVGVIVVTHNKDGLPVRALKTNKLGQFVAATPLPNGIYTITLEKEPFVFDNLQLDLEGAILPPIRVAAKKGL